MGAILMRAACFIPVSYTHLKVKYSIGGFDVLVKAVPAFSMHLSKICLFRFFSVIPVSYTHLPGFSISPPFSARKLAPPHAKDRSVAPCRKFFRP